MNEEEIKKSVFVFTRNISEDYNWVRKPKNINTEALLQKMEEVNLKFHLYKRNFTSEWYSTRIEGNKIVFRIVKDGQKDQNGRDIIRYEGTTFPDITRQTAFIVEDILKELQEETNNYGNGYYDERKKAEQHETYNKRSVSENCKVEIDNGQIIIKSDILDRFLERHTLRELLTHLKVEPREIDREEEL